jgi:hypothetical protein
VQEEDGCDEGEGEDKNDKWISVELKNFRQYNTTPRYRRKVKRESIAWGMNSTTAVKYKTHTLNPGESSV